jgi:hypothetical protein
MPEQEQEVPQEPECGGSTRLFRINEPDLAELERIVPLLMEQGMIKFDTNAARVRLRKVKQILSDVRWNYGPWSHVEEIPANQ